ncbi:MAG: HD domain-containing protein [Patescibacteria group bacterium]|jgi:5'-deoxynucleotidase YfbR-like HD superfamily hydrolase
MKNYQQYPLKFEGIYFNRAQKIINLLFKIPRTGWCDRNVENPETVGEHTDELVSLSGKLFKIPGLSEMLKIHDWPESEKNIGDRRTDPCCPEERRCSPEKKYKDELEAMNLICSKLGPYGKRIFNLWLEFEEKKTERAIIAYQLDKYQAIMKAIEYQLKGQPVIAKEFIEHDGPKIKHPTLRNLLDEAIKMLS